jgi:NADP-dependent 3-hydroxy acid dehydrogenase YdfG
MGFFFFLVVFAGTGIACDVGDYEQLEEKLIKLPVVGESLRIRGIFHAAGLLSQQLVQQVTADEIKRVLHPKVEGTWALHRLALHSHQLSPNMLQHFVCWSSISAIVPTRGEVAYGASNAFLDALTYYRQSLGFPSTVINWGVISGTGMYFFFNF